ncbi:MAG: hypothetical protein JOZ49_12065 [Mycolicibacterium sp.]|nr:hypothetical protein [Mycolicibacterium sp.]
MSSNGAWLAGVNSIISTAPPTQPYTPEPAASDTPVDPNARPKRALAIFGGAVAVTSALVVGLAHMLGNHPAAAPVSVDEPTIAAAPMTSSVAPLGAPGHPEPIPYSASDHCPVGSTQAQALADTTTDSWWICVRGQVGAELDGQIIHIDLGKPQIVTSVQIVPGALAKTRGGKDEWDKHRVVKLLQYNFCDGAACIPVNQDTTDGHGGPVPRGPVTKILEHPMLASTVDVIIQHTEAPAATTPSTTASADPLPTLAPSTTADAGSNPVDYTVAVGSLKFFGYPPTGP